ncbi:aminodeoxychorismate synthase, subunit II [Desulfamplus magnetovallimortis]|uniref:Aminodeoxychorismate synthase, subunit II n=1 Tax=Desulfamplus magnetovallimortis TaxID=1246637 RepID=A0A1W1HL14_9BACT|nr:aminodeoxychorismate/anthranilate synthase component II [Desulfamplus magnetovallimortis]SLM33197.1 aminodeoxychorismate synthase, subunit II [Desulfamplus magnetovallimortis]
MLIAVIDNYDSFTFNLVHYIMQSGAKVNVFRNNRTTVEEIEILNPEGIVISPGPGRPEDAGISMETVNRFSGKIPILGVCLGHQTIAHCFGGDIVQAKRIMHGKTSMVTGDDLFIFKGIKKPFAAMRYHSLAVSEKTLPECLVVTARSDDGEIMGLRHREHPTHGVQFHPESIMTVVGKRIIRNFVREVEQSSLKKLQSNE